MSFLKRLFGDGDKGTAPEDAAKASRAAGGSGPAPSSAATDADDEAARDRELMRAEADRLSDELIQRQMRYADRSWTPPPQGGTRRAGEAAGADED